MHISFKKKKGGGVGGGGGGGAGEREGRGGGGEILLKTIMAIHRFDVVRTGVENLCS